MTQLLTLIGTGQSSSMVVWTEGTVWPEINWRLLVWIAVFFLIWYSGPAYFQKYRTRCNYMVISSCEP